MSDPLHRILYRGASSEDDNEYPFTLVEGVILAVDASGITFKVPTWNEGSHLKHGPAPYAAWTATSTSSSPVTTTTATHGPAAGYRCLVAFLGTGLENPWVIGWWPS